MIVIVAAGSARRRWVAPTRSTNPRFVPHRPFSVVPSAGRVSDLGTSELNKRERQRFRAGCGGLPGEMVVHGGGDTKRGEDDQRREKRKEKEKKMKKFIG
ncbi:hypothetical protein JHK86_005607 [Glycine max]|nr:hypothetical protein JHK86_005607 [Glycine max]